MKILAISCHPDDVEIACAGTLAKCVRRGDEVTVCHVANGDLGHAIIHPPELRNIRAEEAKRAGSLAGIKVITCDVGDLMVYEGSKEHYMPDIDDAALLSELIPMLEKLTPLPKPKKSRGKA